MNKANVLVLYYSQHGITKALAESIMLGAEKAGADVCLRTVPRVSTTIEAVEDSVPESGAPYVTHEDLIQCDALALGSPTHFGNMAAAMKHFLDTTSSLWLKGALIDKPAGVFTSSSSLHGGQESTLLSMMLPLLHHGMAIIGVPYAEPGLHQTSEGGTPYGPSALSRDGKRTLSNDEKSIAIAFGKRLAQQAIKSRKNS
jgi:NAD(P)H dehydrogenase (quinone)